MRKEEEEESFNSINSGLFILFSGTLIGQTGRTSG
jgi:hypothetical protein